MRRVFVVTTLLLAVHAHGNCQGQQHEDRTTIDCGTQALYAIVRMERGGADLDRLRASLPGRPEVGYSMRQLRDAARAEGVRLVGVLLPKVERAPDRPALVFLNVPPHGHYVVIRPVGQSGKLVQVIDSAKAHPEVLDAALLYRSPVWTGLALVPRRLNWPARLGGGLVAGGLVAGGLALWKRRGSSSRRGRLCQPDRSGASIQGCPIEADLAS